MIGKSAKALYATLKIQNSAPSKQSKLKDQVNLG